MKAINRPLAALYLASVLPFLGTSAALGAMPVHLTQFEELVAKCAPDIHPQTFKSVVTTESTFQPFAIGVVNGKVERTPRTQEEAIAAAEDLEKKGFNFSLGLAQVNRHNLAKYGESYQSIFEPCRNIRVGAAILKDCYVRAKAKIPDEQQALRASFSCYYSGNFTRGFKPDRPGEASYVQKVVTNALGAGNRTVVPAVLPQDGETMETGRAPGRQPTAKLVKAAASDWVSFGDLPEPEPGLASPELAPVVVERITKKRTATVQQKPIPESTDAFVMVVD